MSFLPWVHVSPAAAAQLDAAGSDAERRTALDAALVGELKPELRQIVLDYHLANLRFCREAGFDAKCTSTLLSLMKQTLEGSMAGLLAPDAAFAAFKELLLRHSVQRPPYSIGVFSLQQMAAIDEHALTGLFRHYRMYRFAFTAEQRTSVVQSPAGPVAEAPPVFQPLAAAEEQFQDAAVGMPGETEDAIAGATGRSADEVREAFIEAVGAQLADLQTTIRTQDSALSERINALENKAAVTA